MVNRSQLTITSTSDLLDKTHISGFYSADPSDNTLLHGAYTEFLPYNSGKAECYPTLLIVKYGKLGSYLALLHDKHPHEGVIQRFA